MREGIIEGGGKGGISGEVIHFRRGIATTELTKDEGESGTS
jgi:hypothetical protein